MLALAGAAGFWAPHLLGTLRHARALGAAAPLAFVLVHALGGRRVRCRRPCSPSPAARSSASRTASSIRSLAGRCGASTAFLLGRHVVRHLVARCASTSRRASRPSTARSSSHGARILFLMRLSPVMPFNVFNYAARHRQRAHCATSSSSSVGMLPGTMVAAYAGQVAGEALALAGQTHPVWNSSYYVALRRRARGHG